MIRRRTGFTAILVSLIAPLLLVACGRAEATSLPATPLPAGAVDTTRYKKAPPYTFCFSNASASNSWRLSMVEHVRYEARHHAEIATYREADAKDDPATQISDIQRLLSEGCDALLVSPAKLDELKPSIDAAMAQGVPVILIDRTVTGDNYVSYVSANNCTIGQLQAEWLVQELGGRGDIVLLSGVKDSSVAEDRMRCAREVFAKAPEIHELAQAYANWSPVDGKKAMQGWLQTLGHIDGIWSDGSQGVGAVEAYLEAGVPVPPITGGDINSFLKQWKRNGFSAVAVSYPARVGQLGVTTALDVLAGVPVPHHVDIPLKVITNDTLDSYVRMDLPDGFWGDSDPEVVKLMFPQ
ncbi:substrate-binding domain-containing protein [Oscillochloris sp. ZM17-4]|uniref:substrate-binding domain-containing protein n=1 Tax=Oscillochloris sp. ZM17-4 TaxID=2866714 RepID=UPI0021077599|nr:substrate-binding domain-containing protein [Oscillochloris sp. ZM17-4]